MAAIAFFGVDVDDNNLFTLLVEAAQGAPRTDDPELRRDGQTWGNELVGKLRGTPLWPTLGRALTRMVADGLPHHVEWALRIAAYQKLVGNDALEKALGRTDLSDETWRMAARELGEAILDGRAPYSADLRRWAADPRLLDALVPVYVLYDHDWFLDEPRRVLGDDPDEAETRLGMNLGLLRQDEVATLHGELSAVRAKLGDAMWKNLDERIQWWQQQDDFKKRAAGPIRWKTAPRAVP